MTTEKKTDIDKALEAIWDLRGDALTAYTVERLAAEKIEAGDGPTQYSAEYALSVGKLLGWADGLSEAIGILQKLQKNSDS